MGNTRVKRVDYKSEVVLKIINAIRESGSNDVACEAVSINKSTFYKWLRTRPEFKKQVDDAHKEYIDTNPLAIQRQCDQRLRSWAIKGYTEDIRTFKEQILDPSGKIVSHRISETIIKKPIAKWVHDRVRYGSSNPMPLMQAMEILLKEGVATPEQVNIIRDGIQEIENKLKTAVISSDTEEQ